MHEAIDWTKIYGLFPRLDKDYFPHEAIVTRVPLHETHKDVNERFTTMIREAAKRHAGVCSSFVLSQTIALDSDCKSRKTI
jgi:hypothetical protein